MSELKGAFLSLKKSLRISNRPSGANMANDRISTAKDALSILCEIGQSLPWVSSVAKVSILILERFETHQQNRSTFEGIAEMLVSVITIIRDLSIKHHSFNGPVTLDLEQLCHDMQHSLTSSLNDMNAALRKENGKSMFSALFTANSVREQLAEYQQRAILLRDNILLKTTVNTAFEVERTRKDLDKRFDEVGLQVSQGVEGLKSYSGQYRILRRGDIRLISRVGGLGYGNNEQEHAHIKRRKRGRIRNRALVGSDAKAYIDYIAEVLNDKEQRIVRRYQGANAGQHLEEDLEHYGKLWHPNFGQIIGVSIVEPALAFSQTLCTTVTDYMTSHTIPTTEKLLCHIKIRADFWDADSYLRQQGLYAIIGSETFIDERVGTFTVTDMASVLSSGPSNTRLQGIYFSNDIWTSRARTWRPNRHREDLWEPFLTYGIITRRSPQTLLDFYTGLGIYGIWIPQPKIFVEQGAASSEQLRAGCIVSSAPSKLISRVGRMDERNKYELVGGWDQAGELRGTFRDFIWASKSKKVGRYHRYQVKNPYDLVSCVVFDSPASIIATWISQAHDLLANTLSPDITPSQIAIDESFFVVLQFKAPADGNPYRLCDTFMAPTGSEFKSHCAYFFVRDAPTFDISTSQFHAEFYWSSSADGRRKWSSYEVQEYLANWGLEVEDLEVQFRLNVVTWDTYHYDFLRSVHAAFGLDSDTSAAREYLELPVIKILPKWSRFFEESELSDNDEFCSDDESVYFSACEGE